MLSWGNLYREIKKNLNKNEVISSFTPYSLHTVEVFCWEGIACTWVLPMKVGLKKNNPVGKLFHVLSLPRKCQESSCRVQGPRVRLTHRPHRRFINTLLVHCAACSSWHWGWCWQQWSNGSKDGAGGDSGSAPQRTHTEARGAGCWLSLLSLMLELGLWCCCGLPSKLKLQKATGKWSSVLQLVREEWEVTKSQFQGPPPPNWEPFYSRSFLCLLKCLSH